MRRSRYRVLLLIVWIAYLIVCPFTKVEESFNTQAVHDLLYHGFNVTEYDHREFPGVVPRTFLGSLVVASLAYPAFLLVRLITDSKFVVLILSRFSLGLACFYCLNNFQNAIRRQFGGQVDFWFTVITATQFHFNFYATRFLPNTFGLALVLQVYAFLLNGRVKKATWLAVFSAFILRSELVLVYAPLFLATIFIDGNISIMSAIWNGILSLGFSLALTVPVDSFFWGRLLWPEGEVLLFNTILNKSSEWGVSPFIWYFNSALPRMLLTSFIPSFIAPLLAGNKLINRMTYCSIIFVLAYSVLPHKELRFIIYAVPLLNLAAAKTITSMWQYARGKWLLFYRLIVIGHLISNIVAASFFTYASVNNYPGGVALHKLNNDEFLRNRQLRIYIDVHSAQTGISRFLHQNDKWRYDKNESINDLAQFDCAVYGESSKALVQDTLFGNHSILSTSFQIESYDGFKCSRINYFPFIVFRWLWKPSAFVDCIV